MRTGAADLAERIRAAHQRGDTAEAERLTAELDRLDDQAKASTVPPAAARSRAGAIGSLIVTVAAATGMALAVRACVGTGEEAAVPAAAVEKCQEALRAQAAHPSTVQFLTTGLSTAVDEADRAYRVRQDFRAKSAFGLELRFDGLCIFPPGQSLEEPRVLIRESAS